MSQKHILKYVAALDEESIIAIEACACVVNCNLSRNSTCRRMNFNTVDAIGRRNAVDNFYPKVVWDAEGRVGAPDGYSVAAVAGCCGVIDNSVHRAVS